MVFYHFFHTPLLFFLDFEKERKMQSEIMWLESLKDSHGSFFGERYIEEAKREGKEYALVPIPNPSDFNSDIESRTFRDTSSVAVSFLRERGFRAYVDARFLAIVVQLD